VFRGLAGRTGGLRQVRGESGCFGGRGGGGWLRGSKGDEEEVGKKG
jgi:hypothetical protein